jgi:hypothetical protein
LNFDSSIEIVIFQRELQGQKRAAPMLECHPLDDIGG